MISRLFIAKWILVILVIECVFCQPNTDSSGGHVEVAIAFNSRDASKTFFTSGLNPIFDEISKCVEWNFIPHSSSDCTCSTEKCEIDAIHACAAHYFRSDEYRLGKFFVCMMKNGDQMIYAEQCTIEAGLDWSKLKTCKPSNEARTWCDNKWAYWSLLTKPFIVEMPGVIFNRKYNSAFQHEALLDLKSAICKKIEERNLQCAAC